MLSSSLDLLPQELRGVLGAFTRQLKSALGEQLISAIVFGGVAKGHFNAQVSDVNVLLVLGAVTLDRLDAIAVAAAPAAREIQLRLMTLAESDLADSAEVFSTKFLDIQRHHLLLSGRDVAEEMQISAERLGRQARRELMNLNLRLRQVYLESRERPEALEVMMKRSSTALLVNLGVLLELRTGQRCGEFEEIIKTAADNGFNANELRQFRQLKQQRALPTDLKVLYETFMHVVEASLAIEPQILA